MRIQDHIKSNRGPKRTLSYALIIEDQT
ncbi:hypothetical protein B4U79_04903 [Dinothrombium tinctorium]|uniref:Uncharacterized protein n=1 Tax=Dinothrombium tinctorium TaxID=1965070 RepID=A0A3S3NRN5_9ACAR|nr:hypothetical protein B4U79_04903 [Dinothrombium tinctorium]